MQIYKSGIGLTASLNLAISMAKSKFIARQDYDDISMFKNRLDIQYNFLKNNNQYIFCASNVSIIDNMVIKNIVNCIKIYLKWIIRK